MFAKRLVLTVGTKSRQAWGVRAVRSYKARLLHTDKKIKTFYPPHKITRVQFQR